MYLKISRAANGVWLSQDPLQYVDGPNMSAYVGQSPNNNTDPLGLSKRDQIPSIRPIEPIGVPVPVLTPASKTRLFFLNDPDQIWQPRITNGSVIEQRELRSALQFLANDLRNSTGASMLANVIPSSLPGLLLNKPWLYRGVSFKIDNFLVDRKGEEAYGRYDKDNNEVVINVQKIHGLAMSLPKEAIDQGFVKRYFNAVELIEGVILHELIHDITGQGELTAYPVENILLPGMIDVVSRLRLNEDLIRQQAAKIRVINFEESPNPFIKSDTLLSSEQFTWDWNTGKLYWNYHEARTTDDKTIVRVDWSRVYR